MKKFVVFTQHGVKQFCSGIAPGKTYEIIPEGYDGKDCIVDEDGCRRSAALIKALSNGWAHYSKPMYMENK